jgi:hypothetical protein
VLMLGTREYHELTPWLINISGLVRFNAEKLPLWVPWELTQAGRVFLIKMADDPILTPFYRNSALWLAARP